MKKFFAVFALIILAVTPLCLVGCKSKYDDLAIEMEDNYTIVLGQDENDSITVQARVTGGSDENSQKLSFSPDNERLVKISQEYKNGTNYITLKALAPGKVNIEARTLEGGATKSFVVNIVQPIKSFSIKNQNFVVVRGQEWAIDIEQTLNLEPTNTTQKDFYMSFGANQDISGLEIQDNVLKVSNDSNQDEVVLNITSAQNSDLAPREITLTITDDFVELDKQAQSAQTRFDDGDILVFEKNEQMIATDKLQEINIVSNVLSESEKQVVVRVYSSRTVNVEAISNQTLSTKKSATLENFGSSGKLEYTDFIFDVRFANVVSSGTMANLDFVVKYDGFEFSKQLESIKVVFELAPKTLLVNDQDNLDEFTLYNYYSIAKRGQKLQFGVLPSSVSSANSKMTLARKNDLVNAFDYIQFSRSNGEEVFEGDEIAANETIYATVKDGAAMGSYEVVLRTKYVNPQTNAPLTKVLKFNVIAGITEMCFVDDDQINIQLNSSSADPEIKFEVSPASVDITKIHIENVEGLEFSEITKVFSTAEKTTLKFTIHANSVGTHDIKVYSENGFEITKKVKVINALESVVLSVPSSNENSVVGYREIINGTLNQVSISLGGTVSLTQTMSPSGADYRVEYSYFESQTRPEFLLSSYEYKNAITSTSMGVLDYSQLLGYGKLVALKEGYAVIRAKYIPIGIVDNTECELEPIYQYFIVQAYKPIRSISLSSFDETIYSLSSVGAYKKDLTVTRVTVSVYPTDATYANNISFTYDRSGEYYDFEYDQDQNTIIVSAKNATSATNSIKVTLTELNKTYTQTLSVTIRDAKMVGNIVVSGVGDSIYVENDDDEGKTIVLNAIAFPIDAYNTKLRYDLIDQSGNVVGDFAISDDGIMSIPAGVGFNGYVRIAAEDCFQEVSAGNYEPKGTNGKNIIMIPIVIANGASKDTAIRINTKEELKNIDTSKHYKIYNDLDVSGITFEGFSGGLYGFDSQTRTVLYGANQTFIKTLKESGCIEDLEISCDISLGQDEKFVLIQNNKGNVKNLLVKGNWTGGSMSLVDNNSGEIENVTSEVTFDGKKFAGIAFTNEGEIRNCTFSGSIAASNQAAGIALLNKGTIDKCATLILEGSQFKLSDSDNQSKIAGLCVENAANGKILRSYIHSYKHGAAFSATDFANASGFVYVNNGTIQKCFSALNEGELVVGFVYMNNTNAKIENCYSNTTFATENGGTIRYCYSLSDDARLNSATDCYSGSDVTSKTVSDWLATNWDISDQFKKTATWKIYNNEQNPFLSEVAAEVKPESMIISVNEPDSTNSYIKISDNQVVLYFYDSNVSPLSTAEKAKLNNLNSISLYDLLKFDVSPAGASSSPDWFDFTLSDGDALEISGLNVVVRGLGKQTLTITSKLDRDKSCTLDIFTSYPIRDFNIFAASSSLDPTGALSSGTTIFIKRSYTQPLYAKVANSIVLVDREIEYKILDMNMIYENNSDAVPFGLYMLSFAKKETIEEFDCAIKILQKPYDDFELVQGFVEGIFARTLKIVVYDGAESLVATQNSFQMEPIDSLELEIQIKTDSIGDENELTLDDIKDKIINYKIYNASGIDFTDAYFVVDYSIKSFDKKPDDAGFRTFTIGLVIRLKERTSQISGKYNISISPNEKDNVAFSLSPIKIDLTILPQSLQRIDYSHYYAESTVEDSKEVLKANTTPSNALAPGQVGLLEVNLFPSYSEISHVEIKSVSNQGYFVKFQLYEKKDVNKLTDFVMVQQNNNYYRIDDGIHVDYTMITNGTFYLKTQVVSSIPEELTFEIVVSAFRSEDDKNPIVQHIFLAAKFIPSATVEVEGQTSYIVMGRGTTKDMTITVTGEGDVDIYVDNGKGLGNYSYQSVYVGQKSLDSTKNLGTQNQYVWKCPIVVGSKYYNNDTNDVATIRVVVSREVNGVREKKETTLTVRVLDFVVNKIIVGDGKTDQFSSKVSVKTKFVLNFDIDEPQAFTNENDDKIAVSNIKKAIEEFKESQYFTKHSFSSSSSSAYQYYKTFMFVDSLGDHSSAITSSDGSYAYQENEYVRFEDVKKGDEYAYTTVTGLKTGTQKMKFKVAAINPENNAEVHSTTYEFDIVVTNYSTEDKPKAIGSLSDFNAIFDEADALDYILTSDIEIGNFSIISDTSKISSLDGNNHKIIIKSLNLDTKNSLDVALFGTISETTTIKNLIVDYQIGEINVDSEKITALNVAGLAIDNNGIVTNTHVLSSVGNSTNTVGGLQISSTVGQSAQIQMAGFVLNNSGSITNSRVGDTSVTIVDTEGLTTSQPLKIFALVGQDQMAGFVLNNSGIISSCYAKNITITNNSSLEDDNQTAGFVLNNQQNAKITGSYVRGVDSSNQSEVYVLGDGICSSFEVAGFVFDNYSYISDCYSNIKLYYETAMENRAGTRTAGFVFKNELGAEIVSCLSLSKIKEGDTSQEFFCGVDSKNESNNIGSITYSYYYSKNGLSQSIDDGSKMLDSTKVMNKEQFYGYVFTTSGALDGMWFMSSRGPELTSANNIALSKRYLISMEDDKYEVAYVANYEYGSENNPILIRSATEFNQVFGTSKDDSIKKYYDATNKQAFGNYRIINDIDMSDISLGGEETSQISSTNFTLTKKTDEFGGVIGQGVLEGNSMTISNLDFSIVDTNQLYFGLFAAVKGGAVVKNLNITVNEISATSVNFVGSLAGFVEDSKIINVKAEIAQGQQTALVQGRNVVGGVVGGVSGTSELNNVISSISAHATYKDQKEISKVNENVETKKYVQVAVPNTPNEGKSQNSNVSVAGSVVGAVYAKDINDSTNNDLTTIDHAQVQKIKASGNISVSAKIAGGLIGYVGKTTYVHDAWLAISDGQSIIAHDNGIAGGAVGLSYGKLSHVRIEHNDVQDYSDEAENDQTKIEDDIANYYNNKTSSRSTYENMFTSSSEGQTISYTGQTIGGIVGVMNGGILEDSYTKLDVISDAAFNLGGIVGIVKNGNYEISRVYTLSNVQSKSTDDNVLVGGLFGAVLSSGELNTVVGVNYLDKNYTTKDGAKEKYVAFAPFAGACTYVPSMTNVYTLSSIWGSTKDEQKIKDNLGAQITSAKTVVSNKTSLDKLFPVTSYENSINVNEVFEIEDSHFKNSYWARNTSDVLPHLTFGLEEKYFIIDDEDTAGDIRKMLKNSNKTFYINGKVNMADSYVINAIKEVRESIIFTGTLMGMPDDMIGKKDEPTLIGLQQLFGSAVGATFQDFTIENPIGTSAEIRTANAGVLLGKATDCQFLKITIEGGSYSANFQTNYPENVGGLVGLADGKTSFEKIEVKNLTITTGKENNVGLIVGQTSSSINETIFKGCTVSGCDIIGGLSGSNTCVGGVVGYAQSPVTIESSDSSVTGVKIDVRAQYVGGLVGQAQSSLKINKTQSQQIQITCGDDKKSSEAVAVGGIVGQANNLNITMGSNIVLTEEIDGKDDDNWGRIDVTSSSSEVFVGGMAGQIKQGLSVTVDASQNFFRTNNMSVKAPNATTVYAGGVVGSVGGTINLSGLKVNTQGEIQNKILAINCPGNVYAGGIVGSTGNAQIKNCWSGTDVEISNVTTSSEVTFGGIVGSVTEATANVNGNNPTDISGNVSYGRFYLDSDYNINTINAGGIVGSVTKATTNGGQATVSNNKTLTSLEIRRQATKNHNVNAVAGSLSDVTGSGNAYTYQLSLAVESDKSFYDNTTFATNHATLSEVGVSVSDITAETGSILEPFKNYTTIEKKGYYSYSEKTDVSVNYEYGATGETSDTKYNFVLIGNGNTITLNKDAFDDFNKSHINQLHSRSIISGVTIEGKFDYDVSGVAVTIGTRKYEYSNDGLTYNNALDAFSDISYIGDWQDITKEDMTKYYYMDNGNKEYVDIDEDNKEEIDGTTYIVVDGAGTSYAITTDMTTLYTISSTTTYSCEIDGETKSFTDKNIISVVVEDGTLKKATEGAENTLEGVEVDGTLYRIIEKEEGSFLADASGNKVSGEISSTTTKSVSSDSKELQSETVTTQTLNGYEVVSTDEQTTLGNGAKYDVVTINSNNYAKNGDKVARIYTARSVTVKLSENDYPLLFNGSSLVAWSWNEDGDGRIEEGISYSLTSPDAYELSQGFVTTNNGYICGVVVKSNYSSSGFGGFVTTNNGTILFSSMNGQVNNTDNSANVAGFVLENNGIIDYCHSTGAVQGSASNSYSFGVNAKNGALKNSYTIMLNETSGTQSVFNNNGGKFENNEYDLVATETDVPESEITGLTNKLTGVSTDDDATSGYWKTTAIEKGVQSYNYGYKTLSAGPFIGIDHLKMATGSGESNDPFIIANSRMLSKIDSIGTSCSYTLANNIDLSKYSVTSTNWGNIGLQSSFSGTFDGSNKTISNLTYSNTSDLQCVYGGLFAQTSGATIKNLTLNEANITISSTINNDWSSRSYAGGLIGYADNSKILNIAIIDSTIRNKAYMRAYSGGVFGYSSYTTSEDAKTNLKDLKTLGETKITSTNLQGSDKGRFSGFDSLLNYFSLASGIGVLNTLFSGKFTISQQTETHAYYESIDSFTYVGSYNVLEYYPREITILAHNEDGLAGGETKDYLEIISSGERIKYSAYYLSKKDLITPDDNIKYSTLTCTYAAKKIEVGGYNMGRQDCGLFGTKLYTMQNGLDCNIKGDGNRTIGDAKYWHGTWHVLPSIRVYGAGSGEVGKTEAYLDFNKPQEYLIAHNGGEDDLYKSNGITWWNPKHHEHIIKLYNKYLNCESGTGTKQFQQL